MALSELVDLASERVGGAVLAASDYFFASRENLIRDAEAVFDPHAYVPTGKLMDGWESRRRRGAGHDWCLVRLGVRFEERRLTGIPGRPPSLLKPPGGCRFRARCPLAGEECKEEPPFVELEPDRWVACWKAAA